MIKNFIPRPSEVGRIKIGEKGELKTSQSGKQFAQPKKLDHFVITTMQRDAAGRFIPDTALMSRLTKGTNNGKLTEIPIRLIYDDIDLNFYTRFACYKGSRCWCSGDGEIAQRLTGNNKYQEVPCPCERYEPLYNGPDKCKPIGILQCWIEGANRIGGVWRFRTTSWNSVSGILDSLLRFKAISGGPLAGIPLLLTLSPKTVTIPTTGQSMTVYIVGVDYKGSMEELRELGYKIVRRRIEHQIRMDEIENQCRRMLVSPLAESPEEQAEAAAEFYPEGFLAEAGHEGGNPDPFNLNEPSPPEDQQAEGEPIETLPPEGESPEQSEVQPIPTKKGKCADQAQALF